MAEQSSRQQEQVERLLLAFTRKGKKGRPRYSQDDRKRLVRLVLVTLIPPARYPHLPPRLKRMLGQLSIAAKVQSAKSSQETMRGLQAFFRRYPPSPAILRDFNDALRTLNRRLEADARKAQAAQTDGDRSDMAEPPPPGVSAPSPQTGVAPTSALDDLLPSELGEGRKLVLDNLRHFRNLR